MVANPDSGAQSAMPKAPGRTVAGAVFSAWVVLVFLIAWHVRGRAADDIFITYRYADNLVSRGELVFNPGERVFGVSDPGVALALASGRFLTGLAIPFLGTLLTAVALLVIAGLVLRDSAQKGLLLESAVGGTLVVASPYLWLGQGSGPLVALAFLVASATVAERRPLAAGLLAGIAVWSRPDAGLGCAALAVLLLLGREPRKCWRFCVTSGALIVAGCGLATVYFGHPLPTTLSVKRQVAALNPLSPAGSTTLWSRAATVFSWTEGRTAWWMIAFGCVGAVVLARRGGIVGRFIVFNAVLLSIAYSAFRLPFFVWYMAPQAVVLLFGACAALRPLRGWAERLSPMRVRSLAIGGVFLLLFLGIGMPPLLAGAEWFRTGAAHDWRFVAYRAAGEWLAKNSPPESDVAAEEVGLLAFYGQRRVVDLIGLTTPGSIPYAAAGDQLGAFLASPSRYVLFHTFTPRGGTRPIVSRPWFAQAFREAVRLDFPELGGSAILYERRPGTLIPESRPPVPRSGHSPSD